MRISSRAICVCFLLLAVMFPLCAGVAGDVWSLKTASTAHFDIIYSDGNRETASLLYENCEDIYASLVEFFGSDPDLHIPVVVTSKYKELNAYYSSHPANRIVMFDTVADHGQLSNYPQTILYIFRHELTHAFQFNFRGPFMEALSDIFSDALSLGMLLYLYPSLSEGGAVLTESMDGYGRLNSSYAMQIVKQAKLEGLFPNWFEIAGARDTYPSGLLYYNFAAAFLEYLSITYGYDTVADVYVSFKSLRLLSTPGNVIKEKIGKSVQEAWQDFYEWVEVPEDVSDSSSLNALTRAGRFAVPVLSSDGSIYVYDSSTNSVLRFSDDLNSCSSVLVLPTGGKELSLSADGNLMLIPLVSETKACVQLYSLASGSGEAELLHEFSSTDRDYRGGCFVSLDTGDYVLLYANSGQNTFLDLYSLDTMRPVTGRTLELGFGVTASCFTSLADGNAAFILNSEAHDRIALLDVSDMSLRLLDNPEDLSFMSLTSGTDGRDVVLSFSWYPADAKATNLGRYGELIPADDGTYEMRLSSTDVLGSMNGCIRTGDRILFTAQYYESARIRTIGVSDLEFAEPVRLGLSDHDAPEGPDTLVLSTVSTDYQAIRYFFDGLLLPYFNFVIEGDPASPESVSYVFGPIWLTSDPTETHTHQLSVLYMSDNVGTSYIFKSSNFAVPYSVSLSAVFGLGLQNGGNPLYKGLLQASAEVQASWSTTLRHEGESVGVSEDYTLTMQKMADGSFTFINSNEAEVSYSFGFRTGTNPYDAFRFKASAFLSDLNPGITLSFSFPRILWWQCNGPDVTNIPFAAGIGVQMANGGGLLIAATARAILYSHEIQWSSPFFGLYLQRFAVGSSYEIGYSTALGSVVSHKLSFDALVYMSPIVGSLLTKLKIGLGGTLEKDLTVGWDQGWKFSMAFSI